MDANEFAKLTPTERARQVSLTRLRKHFLGLQDAGLLDSDETRKYLGAIRILEAMIDGDFVPQPY